MINVNKLNTAFNIVSGDSLAGGEVRNILLKKYYVRKKSLLSLIFFEKRAESADNIP